MELLQLQLPPEHQETVQAPPPPSITNIVIQFSSFTPLMHPEKFSDLTGLSIGVVQGHIRSDYLPTVKQGRYRMINIVALTNLLAQQGIQS